MHNISITVYASSYYNNGPRPNRSNVKPTPCRCITTDESNSMILLPQLWDPNCLELDAPEVSPPPSHNIHTRVKPGSTAYTTLKVSLKTSKQSLGTIPNYPETYEMKNWHQNNNRQNLPGGRGLPRPLTTVKIGPSQKPRPRPRYSISWILRSLTGSQPKTLVDRGIQQIGYCSVSDQNRTRLVFNPKSQPILNNWSNLQY